MQESRRKTPWLFAPVLPPKRRKIGKEDKNRNSESDSEEPSEDGRNYGIYQCWACRGFGEAASVSVIKK